MNPNIAMGFQRPRFDPQEGQRNALAMRQAQMQEATQVMQMQQAQQAAQQQAARRNALASADWNSPESLTQARGALGQQGDIDGVMAIDNHLRSLSKAQRDAATAELDAIPKLVGGLSNPTTYQQTRAMAARVAPEFYAGLPEEFDPQIVDPINRAAMSASDWRNQQNADRTAEIARERNEIYKNRPVAGGVTLVNQQESAEKKARGANLVKQYDEVRAAADMAQGELGSLQQLRGINVQSGRLEELKAGIASYAQALGIDPATLNLQDPTNAQSFIGTAQQLVLRVMQAQKGPQTENDAKRIEQTVASLGNTPQAKDFLIDSAMAVRKRDIERADFFDTWYEDKGTYDGARKAWQMRIEKIPLLGNNPKTGLPVFYDQFRSAVMEANPGMTEAEAETMWRKKYGR
jgi:hypothetical protein